VGRGLQSSSLHQQPPSFKWPRRHAIRAVPRSPKCALCKPDVSRLQVWGCKAYVLTPKRQRDGKLVRVIEHGIVMGHANGDTAFLVRP
jgi:hypothetical protein